MLAAILILTAPIFYIIGVITVIKWLYNMISLKPRNFEVIEGQKEPKTKKNNFTRKYNSFQKKQKRNEYYESAYFFATKNSYSDVKSDAGKHGEYIIYDYLKDYQKSGGKFLFNTYLPRNGEQTTEIDLMLIHQSGIFVIESKNYSGWIFGNDNSSNWTQMTFHKGQQHKQSFFSPIEQNKLHIECLKRIVGPDIPIYSVIVFADRCQLKDVTVNTPDVYVIKSNQTVRTISTLLLHKQSALDEEGIEETYKKLYPYTQVTEEVKKQHIENLHKNNAI